MKKYLALILVVMLAFIFLTGCNKTLVDMKYNFNYAWISLPAGEYVKGPVQSWTDFEDGDQIQVKIGGVTYLTDTTRCVMASGYFEEMDEE